MHALTTTTTVPELLDCLRVAQEHDTILQKYWQLAHGTHLDYGIVYNPIGEFFTFKGQLYIPKNLVQSILYEYHEAQGYFG